MTHYDYVFFNRVPVPYSLYLSTMNKICAVDVKIMMIFVPCKVFNFTCVFDYYDTQ